MDDYVHVHCCSGGAVVAGCDGSGEHIVDSRSVEACDESFDES